jgi:glycosyltransferase involved in cell wall biosynthesis
MDRATARRRAGLPLMAPVVLTIGRFSEQKGHRYLLDAIPAIVARVPDACFAWVGSGELAADLRARVAAEGLADQVRFLGQRDDIPTLLAAADLFVLPSLFEGLPLVALEAMAAGLPVVGTRVCGTAEAVADGVTGRLVDPQDGAALAAGILEVLAQPDRGARWGAAGRRRVAAHFRADQMAAATARIYEELVSTYRPCQPVLDYYPALS